MINAALIVPGEHRFVPLPVACVGHARSVLHTNACCPITFLMYRHGCGQLQLITHGSAGGVRERLDNQSRINHLPMIQPAAIQTVWIRRCVFFSLQETLFPMFWALLPRRGYHVCVEG